MYSLHMMFQKQRLKPKTNNQTKNGLENLIKSKKKKKVCLEQNVTNRIWTTDYKLVGISYFIPSAQGTVQISKKPN